MQFLRSSGTTLRVKAEPLATPQLLPTMSGATHADDGPSLRAVRRGGYPVEAACQHGVILNPAPSSRCTPRGTVHPCPFNATAVSLLHGPAFGIGADAPGRTQYEARDLPRCKARRGALWAICRVGEEQGMRRSSRAPRRGLIAGGGAVPFEAAATGVTAWTWTGSCLSPIPGWCRPQRCAPNRTRTGRH